MSDDESEVQGELEGFTIGEDLTPTEHFVFDGSLQDYRALQRDVQNTIIFRNCLISLYDKIYDRSNDREWLYPADSSIIRNYFYAIMEAYLDSYTQADEDRISRDDTMRFILDIGQALDTSLVPSQLSLPENFFDNL